MDEGGGLQGRPAGTRQGQALLHRDPATQRDGIAAYGARAQQHAAGHPVPFRAHARPRRALAARHRPRRHRDPARGRAADDGAAGARPAHDRPREVPGEGVGVEGRERRHHHQSAQAARGLLRLGPRALHHGRGAVEGRDQGLRRSLRGRADLQGQAPRQLGPGVPERHLRPRGRHGRGEGRLQLDRGRCREAVRRQGARQGARPQSVRAPLPLPLPPDGEGGRLRQGLHRRRHHAARDHAGRHGRCGASQGQALSGADQGEGDGQAAAGRARDPDRRR